MDLDDGCDTIISKTGATGDALEDMNDIADDIFGSIPVDMQDVGSAIGEVNTRFEFTGNTLEDASKKFLKFANINNMDVSKSVQLVSRMMGDAGIPASEYATILDQLTVASQKSGIEVSTLAENLTKYGAPMRQLGFDTQSSIAIFSQWEKAGVNTEIAFSGMKKAIANWTKEGKDGKVEFANFVKGVQDGSISAQEALDVFGTKAGPDLVDAIQQGRFSYQDFMGVIQNSSGAVNSTFENMQDPWDKLKIAFNDLKLAGGELGKTIMESLQPTFEKLSTTIKKVTEWYTGLSDGQQKMIVKLAAIAVAIGPAIIVFGKLATGVSAVMKAFSAVKVALTALSGPVGIAIVAITALVAAGVAIYKNWDKIKAKAQELWGSIKETFGNIKEWFSEKFAAIGDFFGKIGTKCKETFTSIKDTISEKLEGAKNAVTDKLGQAKENMNLATDAMKEHTKQRLGEMKQAYDEHGGGIKGSVSAAMEGVKGFYRDGYNVINNLTGGRLGDVVNSFKDKMGQAKDKVSDKLGNIKDSFQDKLNSARDTVSNILGSIKEKFESIMNGAKDIVSGAIDKIKGFFDFDWHLPDLKLPHFSVSGHFSLNPPSIPHFSVDWFAKGGILNSPTLIGANGNSLMGAGEAGKEAVLPISLLKQYMREENQRSNAALIQALLEAFKELGINITIENYIDGQKAGTNLVKSVIKKISTLQKNDNIAKGLI